jgi:hypothetical protein
MYEHELGPSGMSLGEDHRATPAGERDIVPGPDPADVLDGFPLVEALLGDTETGAVPLPWAN